MAAQTLDGLMQHEAATGYTGKIGGAWRGAEAFHFWMLAHRQLYQGDLEGALRTGMLLREFDDILEATDVYCFIALAAFHCRQFGYVSSAFVPSSP